MLQTGPESNTVREAVPGDIPQILALYNQAVRETTATWTHQEEHLDERINWFENRVEAGFPVIVAERGNGTLTGYASYGPFRAREGYRYTAEHTVYVAPGEQNFGIGSILLNELIERARLQGIHILVGAVDGDNAASIAFHEKHGFSVSGRLPQAGAKFGRWLDLVFVTRVLKETPVPPPAP